jgi:hypothetical protein
MGTRVPEDASAQGSCSIVSHSNCGVKTRLIWRSYLGIYSAIAIGVLGCVVYGRMVWAYGTSESISTQVAGETWLSTRSVRASRKIHNHFVRAIAGTTFRYVFIQICFIRALISFSDV